MNAPLLFVEFNGKSSAGKRLRYPKVPAHAGARDASRVVNDETRQKLNRIIQAGELAHLFWTVIFLKNFH
jgi:hypothetical protein